MSTYDISSLNSGGLRVAHHGRDCADDKEAIATARSTIFPGGVAEIWAGSRKVEHVSTAFAGAARIAFGSGTFVS